jgi:DNA-binding NarL/FixJ family response regulator
MRIVILTPVRLLGESVAAALCAVDSGLDCAVAHDLGQLRSHAASAPAPALVIVDVTQLDSLEHIRAFHVDYPRLPLLALGLRDREAEIVAHGSAGFTGYLRREDGLDMLGARVRDAISGRMPCSPEIAGAIMRGLFQRGIAASPADLATLTPREEDVALLVSRGLSNKEIARELALSESTVKHHVHNVLSKTGTPTRVHLMRRVRQDPWRAAG